jgi:GST-like protein
MIELYSFPTPNGHKVSIALEELELPYEVIPINIARGDQQMPEFLAISPNGRIPAILDLDPADGGPPLSIAESGAILIYLARKTGRLLPADPRAEAEVLEWVMWQMANFGPMLGQLGHFRRFAPEPIEYAIGRYADEADRLYHVLDDRLEGREWIVDEYGIADILCAPWVSFRGIHEIEIERYPNVERWWNAFQARPAVQRGLQAGSDRWADPPMSAQAKARLFLREAASDVRS